MSSDETGFVRAVVATWGVRLANSIVAIAFSILISRALGPEGRGEYYFPMLVASTLFSFLHLGAEQAQIFLVSQGRSMADLAASAAMLAAGAGTIGIIAGLAAWAFFGDSLMSGVSLGILTLALLPLPLSLHHLYLAGLLVLRGEVVRIQRINLWTAVLRLVALGILYAGNRVSVGWVVGISSAMTALTWALTARLFSRVASPRPRWRPDALRETLSLGLRMHVGLICSYLNLRIDGYLVKHFLGLRELGYYSLAVSLAELVWLATDSVAIVMLPRQTHATLHDAATLTLRTCRVNLVVALVLATGLAGLGYPLIRVAYGDEFLPSLPALWLLLPGIVVASLWRPLWGYLVKLGHPMAISAISAFALLVNLGGNVTLIPTWGIEGAAVATTGAYGALAAAYLVWFLRRSGVAPRDVLGLHRDGAGVWRSLRREVLRLEK